MSDEYAEFERRNDSYREGREDGRSEMQADLATARAEIERLRARLAAAEFARDAALRQCAELAAKCGEAEGKLQGSELAGVVRDWQERAEKAESRLAKVGEIVESSFAKADEERLQETYKARDEAEKWKSEGDMYGWNFHQGMSSGTIGASIIYHRMKRELEAAMKGE